jgi:hypothetical protein
MLPPVDRGHWALVGIIGTTGGEVNAGAGGLACGQVMPPGHASGSCLSGPRPERTAAPFHLRCGTCIVLVVPPARKARDMTRMSIPTVVILAALAAWPFAALADFHLQEATIADIHRAILAKELTTTEIVGLYLKRIAAYNGQCVAGAADANGYVLGDIEPIEKAGKVGALMTLNIRGKRSKTDTVDDDPAMPDALETARALDEEFARTGRLKGPLHGIVFAIKDQFDTFDMRSTSGSAAAYANDRPPRDAEVVARLRAAGAIILAKSNMGEYASGDRSTFGGTTCNPYDTSRSAGRSSGGSGASVAANLVTCAIGEETGPSARNPAANGSLDDRFHESCHKRGDSSWFPDSYICRVCAQETGSWQRGGGRLNCRSEMRIQRS